MKMQGYGLVRDEEMTKLAAGPGGFLGRFFGRGAKAAPTKAAPKVYDRMAPASRQSIGVAKTYPVSKYRSIPKEPEKPAGFFARFFGRGRKAAKAPAPKNVYDRMAPASRQSVGVAKTKPVSKYRSEYDARQRAAAQQAPQKQAPAPVQEQAPAPQAAQAPAPQAQAPAQQKFDWNSHIERNKNRYYLGAGALAGSALTGMYLSNRNPEPYYGYPRHFY